MKKWLRRIRGGIGIGLVWAAAWFGAGMVVLLSIFVSGGEGADVPFPLLWGVLGFLAGATFSGILVAAEKRGRLDEMSMARVTGWGAVAGLLLSGGLVWTAGLGGEALLLGPLFALSGACCAAGSLALARKGNEQTSLGAGGGLLLRE